MKLTTEYEGRCTNCGGTIARGDEALSDDARAIHVNCPAKISSQIIISAGSSMKRGWATGQIVRNNQRRIDSGEPEYLCICEIKSRYYAEDGMSFGVGDESGYVYTLVCREATDDESASLRAKRDEAKHKAAALATLEQIAIEIQERGDRPSGQNTPQGQIVNIVAQDIYGGGRWFVIGAGTAWYVQNNGMDGDDWSPNNVLTGGAGAIGWRVNDQSIVERITKAQ